MMKHLYDLQETECKMRVVTRGKADFLLASDNSWMDMLGPCCNSF